MTDILKPTPVQEMIADLTRRIDAMSREASEQIDREEARSREWCQDRWRRMHDETAALRAQRDAMLKALADTMPMPVLIHQSHCASGHREAVCTCHPE